MVAIMAFRSYWVATNRASSRKLYTIVEVNEMECYGAVRIQMVLIHGMRNAAAFKV